MARYLVIMEAPSKSATVKKYLGKDYEVVASYGHVIDLPKSKFGIDLKKNFEPKYVVIPEKKKVIDDIVAKAKKAEIVYLMTDLDREGTAISFHIRNYLPKETVCKRAITNSITADAVKKAIENAGEIDMMQVTAYEVRRILDRLVGYKCSFVTKQSTGGISAGRVQSAALRVLAEREKEITKFVPIEYWPVEALLLTKNKDKISARVTEPDKMDTKNKEQAEKICSTLKNNIIKVAKIERKVEKQRAYPPFVTLSLVQSTSSIFGWDQKKTMDVAQKLYQIGACTYHRTDSVYIEPNSLRSIRACVGEIGEMYLPEKPNYFASSKNAQEAHEAIRPTDISVCRYGSGDEAKLYELIWKRTVASQMTEAQYERVSVSFKCQDVTLSANGSKRLFDGWRRIWSYGSDNDVIIPDISEGDVVDLGDVKTEQKFTEPPKRYSDASLSKKLESLGIGRPSTWHTIIPTLIARKYVEGKKSCRVTELGLRVSDFLVKNEFCFIDTGFTAEMEKKIDDISEKKAERNQVLNEFWSRLQCDIKRATDAKEQSSITEFKCPQCNNFLLKKYSQFGPFFVCSDKEKCKFKAQEVDGKPVQKEKKEQVYSDKICPKCGGRLLVRKGKKGDFLGCEKYPKCKGIYNTEGVEIAFSKSFRRGRRNERNIKSCNDGGDDK